MWKEALSTFFDFIKPTVSFRGWQRHLCLRWPYAVAVVLGTATQENEHQIQLDEAYTTQNTLSRHSTAGPD